MALVSKKSIGLSPAIHYMDSLFTVDLASSYIGSLPVFDLGTGAGFPGIIYAIRYPHVRIRLYERSLKKQTFLSAAVAQLELTNCEVHGALPDKNPPGFFFARAVLPRDELMPALRKSLAPGSVVVASLGGRAETPPVPDGFLKLGENVYTLPADHGNRKIEILQTVPRGTK